MYIKRVTIKNYRNFGDPPFTIDLKPFTLILGENNIGKTNLLNALGLIFSQDLTVFRRRILEVDDINYDSVQAFKKKVCDPRTEPGDVQFPEVSVEVVLADMNEDQEAVVGDWFINKDLTEAKVSYVFAPRANFDKANWVTKQRERTSDQSLTSTERVRRIDFPIGEYRYSIFGCDDPTNECNMYYLRMLKMEFLDALRDAQRELVASGDYRLLYRVLCQRDPSRYESIKALLYQLEDEVNKNPNLKDIKDEVTRLLDKVSLQTAGADNTVDFSFSSPEASEMLKKVSLIYGSNPISVARNGLGRNNLLYISLVLSHLSATDSRGNSTFFRLIAIEEPEAHLHPHLQDHLAENIEAILEENKESMQLLLTSHSTHIAAKLSLANTVIVFSDRNAGGLKSHYILSGLAHKSTTRYLSKYLDATRSRMLFARKVILVEGIAEQLLVPRFFEICSGDTVERRGCNVVNVNGVAFKHFLRLVRNGFFIKCVVFTDRDTGTATQERAVELKKEFDQPGLIRVEITERSTFEKDLVAANKTGEGKRILLEALRATRPRKGEEFADNVGQHDIDVEVLFKEIERYKSEFAFNLLALLDHPQNRRVFTIPQYMQSGFKFME